MSNIHDELRGKFFGDGFMAGHQVLKIRRRFRSIPEWAKSNKRVQELLLTAFPKLATDEKQRHRAGRWARIIQLYFRSQKSYSETAEELGEGKNAILKTIRRVRLTAEGRTH